MGITLVRLSLGDCSWEGIFNIFWSRWVKYRSDPSTSKATSFSAQDDQVGWCPLLQVDDSWEVILFKIPEEESHPERRVEVPTPVVEWV